MIDSVPQKNGKADMKRIQAEYVQVDKNTFMKFDPLTGVRTTLLREGGNLHVRYEQRVDAVIDLNTEQQNNFKGYNPKAYQHQVARIPNQVWWGELMPKVGFEKGAGFDMKKMKALLNSSDYSKLKTVTGKI